MKRNFENRLDRLEQARGNIMEPGELPESYLIACFDAKTDDQGRELPIVEIGGIFRLHDGTEDDFKDRVLRTVCKGKPLGFKPVLIARRTAPMAVNHEHA